VTVLSDATIERLLSRGDLRIEPYVAKHLTPNGYDLAIGEVVLPEVGQRERTTAGVANVPGRERFLVATREVVTLGRTITAQLWIRSSYARRGVLAAFGKVEAGFSGTLTIGCFNASQNALELPIGDRFCQIAFEALDTAAEKLYAERSGSYQHQRGVTLARDRDNARQSHK
jgi:dCTP deaminase